MRVHTHTHTHTHSLTHSLTHTCQRSELPSNLTFKETVYAKFVFWPRTVIFLVFHFRISCPFITVNPYKIASRKRVQFSRSVMSDFLRPHETQHARPPCPSPTPRVYSNSCPSSRLCHPAISFSVIPFSSCPQALLASGSFPMSQLFAWGGQSIEVSASASVLPVNTPRNNLL